MCIRDSVWRKPVLGDKLGQKVSEVLVVDACHNRYLCEFTTTLFYLDYVPHFQWYPKHTSGCGARAPILACRLLKPYLILPGTCSISQSTSKVLQEAPT